MAMWDTFESRFVITAHLKAVTALRVGAGGSESAQPAASDLPVLVGADDRPFIPGSSLRGVVRSQVERIVRTMEPRSNQEGFLGRGACNPVVGDEWCITSDDMKEIHQKAADKGMESDKWLGEQVWAHSCRVCRTFGSSWFASRVRIADLHLVNPDESLIQRRDGIAIHREKETVQHKFDFETLPRGTTFQLRVTADNLSAAERGLLWLGLRELKEGHVLLGGFKGRGLGQVTLDNLCHQVLPEGDRAALRRYILKGTLNEVSENDLDGWLEELWNELEAE